MTDYQPRDRDPVEAAFADYVKRPQDIVRRQPDIAAADIPSGLGIDCYSNELSGGGLTRENERWKIVAAPILDTGEFMKRRRAQREAQEHE